MLLEVLHLTKPQWHGPTGIMTVPLVHWGRSEVPQELRITP